MLNIKNRYIVDFKGYRQIRVFEHRIIYEEYNKCCLLPHTDIHHINGNKKDNRPENLEAILHHIHSKLYNNLPKTRPLKLCYFCSKSRILRPKEYHYKNHGWTRYYTSRIAPWNKNISICNGCLDKYKRKKQGKTLRKQFLFIMNRV